MIKKINKQKLCILIVVALIVISTVIYLSITLNQNSVNVNETYQNGAVVANGLECAQIGIDILKRNGSAADAAIATLFCEGVTCPQSMGLSGGFLMTIYIRNESKMETLSSREVAPLAATENMFSNGTSSLVGGKSIAVPGELKGYWALYQRYGKLPWSELVQPTIDLCKNGHIVTKYLSRLLSARESSIKKEPSLSEIFVNPVTNSVWKEGDKIKRVKLAKTLEIIAIEKADALYNGSLTNDFINDIQSYGGIVTKEDLLQYSVVWDKAEKSELLDGMSVYSSPLPGSGIILNFMLNILNGFIPNYSVSSFHRIIESFKYGYAKRTEMGDVRFEEQIKPEVDNLTDAKYAEYIRSLIKDENTHNDYGHYGANFSQLEDHGTANINIMAPNGDAISVTSTINNVFGAMIVSQSTGIILNDEMDDFSTPGKINDYGIPASPANFIKPGKRPLSSMCPTIVLDKNGDVKTVIGGAGGSKITSAVVYVIVRHLWLNETIETAVAAKRFHHQLAPMVVQYEEGFDPEIIKGLAKIGHDLKEIPTDLGFASLTAISKENGKYVAVYDPRRGGSIAYV